MFLILESIPYSKEWVTLHKSYTSEIKFISYIVSS